MYKDEQSYSNCSYSDIYHTIDACFLQHQKVLTLMVRTKLLRFFESFAV